MRLPVHTFGSPFFSLAFSLVLILGSSIAQGFPADVKDRPARLRWIERPWELRYFVHVETQTGWDATRQVSKKANAEASHREPGKRYLRWEELFAPHHLVKLNSSNELDNPNLAVVLVTFDKNGFVVATRPGNKPRRGRINSLLRLGLSDGDEVDDYFYKIADWFTGLGDASTHWAPAFCNIYQRPDPFTVRSDDYLYGKFFKPYPHTPLFGCREWAYQLYDNERPYIDVTSYELGAKGQPPKGHIREFIGWARFGDHKPVIGQHEGDWYCLHDCPGGDQPGRIADIQAWAKRFDWSVPLPPTKVPTFPDPPAASGTYPYKIKPWTAPGMELVTEVEPDEQEFPDVRDGDEMGCE